jgi:hypothetical protein
MGLRHTVSAPRSPLGFLSGNPCSLPRRMREWCPQEATPLRFYLGLLELPGVSATTPRFRYTWIEPFF